MSIDDNARSRLLGSRNVALAALLSGAVASCSAAQGEAGSDAQRSQAVCSNPPPLADISRPAVGGVRFYRFDGDASDDYKNAVRNVMTDWENKTGSAAFVEDPANPLAISIDVSATGQFSPGSQIGHELGHAMGLAHEQQRIDSDRFIRLVLQDDLCDDGSEGTKYVDTIWSGTNFGPYNETSVMHYGPGLANDSTYDFTRLDGTTDGFASPDGLAQAGDASMLQEHVARQYGWDRARNRGSSVDEGPLVTKLATNVVLATDRDIAAARVNRVDLTAVFGSNGRVYVSSKGSQASGWRLLFTQAAAIAATTRGGEFSVGRASATGIFVQESLNAQTLVRSSPDGGDSLNDALVWASAISWGLPSVSSGVVELAMASLDLSRLGVLARLANGELWLRRTTGSATVTGAWTRIATGVGGRPAMAAFQGQLRVYYSKTSGSDTTLFEQRCSATSCSTAAGQANTLTGTTAAVSASATELHVIIQNPLGRVYWRREDNNGPFLIIGGQPTSEPVATNSFEDRFGSFALFSAQRDGNLWHRVYNRYFNGRLINLPPNDFDRDGKTDPVIIRNGTWWVLPSSGLPGTSLLAGSASDVPLQAADYDGDGVSDIRLFRPSNGTWLGAGVNRSQTATGAPTTIATTVGPPPLQFGVSTDRPVPGDYDGDWIMDEAVFRPSSGTWFATLSGGGADLVKQFGVSSDRLVPGDYDGDGKTDLALFRPSVGTWYVVPSAGGPDLVVTFGSASDRLVPGDYDCDGRTDFAYFTPSTGHWHIRYRTGEADRDTEFGIATDRVTPGDFDGDGCTDLALFRPSNGLWYAVPSSGGSDIVRGWGQASDVLPWPAYTKTP